MAAKSCGRFLAVLLGSAVLCLAAVALFNGAVDPFRTFAWVEREGVNRYKPALQHRVRLMKAYELRRLRPESVLLGSSRAHVGFDPDHEAWASNYGRRYNAAFDGATTKEMFAYLRHADAGGDVRHVILALDSYHLSEVPGSTRPDFDPSVLQSGPRFLRGFSAAATDLRLLTSLDTLSESVQTIRSQEEAEPTWFATNGQRLGDVFFRRPSENYRKIGPRAYFDEIDRMEVRWKLEWLIPRPELPRPPHLAGPAVDPVSSLGYIAKIVEYCRAEEIELVILLTPAHVHQLEIDAATGSWPRIEKGKRALVRLLAREPKQVPFYDFEGYSGVTTEDLPAPGSRQEMTYYWESSHFKSAAGDLVLDRVFHPDRPPRDDFGVLLTVELIEPALARIRERQAEYRRAHREEVERLVRWIAEFKQSHGIVD